MKIAYETIQSDCWLLLKSLGWETDSVYIQLCESVPMIVLVLWPAVEIGVCYEDLPYRILLDM